ncbi:MAG TPA: cell division protein ZapA [Saprospiraceae bacterium]|jgi:cell division protein ZapA|nr:cell division protein ZapA [Saprospiraceae bacterium]HNT22536.1 cell division protein ZapA [Saprospiraceae bacterium]
MKTLQVMIEGRTYPLKVNEEDAASMLKIVEEVNESLKSLHVSYPQKDRQDCMAMALLTYAVKLYESRADSLSPDIQEKLEVMDRLLDEVVL